MKTADKSIWGRIAKMALEKAVETLVEEGVEAAVEIWRSYQLKLQEEHFEDRKKERKQADTKTAKAADKQTKSYPRAAGGFGEALSGAQQEQSSRATGESTGGGRRSIEALSDYARRSDGT